VIANGDFCCTAVEVRSWPDSAVAGIRQERQLSEDELPYTTIDVSVSGTSVRDPPTCGYFQKAGGVFQKNPGMNTNSVMRVPLQTRLMEHSGTTR
jgi:hypothetical protein